MTCACFHCGLPVAEPGRWRAPVLGAPRDFCCAGCEAVAAASSAFTVFLACTAKEVDR